MSFVVEEVSTGRLVGYALSHRLCIVDNVYRPPSLSEAPQHNGSAANWAGHIFIHDVSIDVGNNSCLHA
jgi:hypothetical protein